MIMQLQSVYSHSFYYRMKSSYLVNYLKEETETLVLDKQTKYYQLKDRDGVTYIILNVKEVT